MSKFAEMANVFLYSQDLSNYKTDKKKEILYRLFLYSQDLSNYKTKGHPFTMLAMFLYSQDLSNYKTLSTCALTFR